ncbi:hypothetical protein N0V94_005130 [Neodidymelliopsis sp. IMI 364377]|nr:hypothetical protein N0V94_005130 [Neodidymelliopsis sp. IMI 364377]
MAPPRTKEKASIATAQITSVRRSVCGPANENEDADDDRTDADDTDVDDKAVAEAEADGLDPSQGTTLQGLIAQSLNDQKKRHTINKKKVKEGYGLTKANLQDRISNLFDEYEDQS